jgi:serine/threonine protein phosphatase PrpC
MHADKRFDDALSGTTSISVLFRGRTMFISNVGDSRAVVISSVGGRLVAKPLSIDKTPYRKLQIR